MTNKPTKLELEEAERGSMALYAAIGRARAVARALMLDSEARQEDEAAALTEADRIELCAVLVDLLDQVGGQHDELNSKLMRMGRAA